MKCFLIDDLDQSLLMPPSLHDWLPENHLARFVVDLVDTLDLSAFYRSYEEKDGRGQAAYHPVMMVRSRRDVYLRLLHRSGQLAADREADVRGCGVSVPECGFPSGSQHGERVSEAAFGSTGGPVRASAAENVNKFETPGFRI